MVVGGGGGAVAERMVSIGAAAPRSLRHPLPMVVVAALCAASVALIATAWLFQHAVGTLLLNRQCSPCGYCMHAWAWPRPSALTQLAALPVCCYSTPGAWL